MLSVNWGQIPINWLALALQRAEAGRCARRRNNFLLLRQKKVTKEKASPAARVPSLRYGQPAMLVRGVCRVTHCAVRAPFGQTRQVRPRSGCVLRHTRHPAPCASRHGQKGKHDTGHCCARPREAQALCAAQCPAERSDGPCRSPSLLEAPVAGRLRGGMRVGARMLRCLTRRSCPSGAPKARSEFCGAPRKRPDAGCPVALRRGRGQQGRASFAFFSCTSKKRRSPAGARPGLRPQQSPRQPINWNLTPITPINSWRSP